MQKQGCAFYLVSHEAAGALMAGGFGRVTGIPGVSLSIKGPGFSNMLSGIASNWLDRNPALSFSESYGPGSSSHRMHKRMAHAQMVRPVVKVYANNPAPEVLTELWNLCLAEEPGPVHVDFSACMNQRSYEDCSAETNDPVLPQEISRLLCDTQRPVVIAGGLAARRAWRGKLARLKIPVLTTVAGKGAIDETLPQAAGVFTNSGGPFAPEGRILPMADLILGLGLRTTEIIDVKPLPCPVILLDELKGKGNGLAAVAEARINEDTFSEALDQLEAKEWGVSEVVGAKTALAKKLSLERWLPAGAFQTVQELLPDSTLFFLDTGNFSVIGEHVLAARHPLGVTGSAQGRSMGVALPASIGAALAKPGTPVVVVVGDGGVRMYPEAITLAVQEKLPLLVLLMSDGFFSSVRQSAVQKGFPESLVRLNSPCWRSVFEALSCPARRIESLHGLEDALKAWKIDSGPLFLELRFEPQAYMAMTEGVR
jgi:acetolactate synthase-1/2/3 large subunit